MSPPRPAISVVIASYNSRKTIESCLESLRRQKFRDFETIVVDSSDDGTADLLEGRFPDIRLQRHFRRLYPGDARNAGIADASGDLIAFLDTDALADENWTAEIVKAHSGAHPVAGAAVDIANRETLVSWAAYFCEFSQWMPCWHSRTMRECPTLGLSLKRWVYDRHGPFIEGTYCSDSEFSWKLAKADYPPLFVPSIRVFHTNIDRLDKFLRKQAMHGEAFGRVRMASEDFSPRRALLYAAGAWLLPILLTWRIARRVFGNRIYRSQFASSLPLVLSGMALWSWGEFKAYFAHALSGVASQRPIVP